jgi:hypothetical protein
VVTVSSQVRSGATRLRVRVTAESIQRAASLVNGSYPDSDAKIDFPIDGAEFSVGDVEAQREQIEFEEPQKTVA